jgi:hypothetical protein
MRLSSGSVRLQADQLPRANRRSVRLKPDATALGCGLLSVMVSLTIVACGGNTTPAPPVIDVPAGTQTVNGTERIGWDQRAADAVELATISYAVYVDGARALLAGASCTSAIAAAGFACSAPLPTLSPGAHTLELVSFVTDGAVLESARSGALRLAVVPGANAGAPVQDRTSAK